MNLRRLSAIAVLAGLGLALACAAGAWSGSSAGDLTDQHQLDEANPLNPNQQYAGWTFGRLMGVSLNPNHVPPRPGF